MKLIDANLILYAEDSLSAHHDAAREWWDAQLSGAAPVGLSWQTLTAFLRIATNPRLHRRPLTTAEAAGKVDGWLLQPCVRVLAPGAAHWPTLRKLLRATKASGNLVSDAHLAALAIEHDATLCSNDGDFGHFPGLRWENPLAA
jgi:hypothetical protein